MEKQEKKTDAKRSAPAKEEAKANPKVVDTGKKLKEEMDALKKKLVMLEENAEEFIKNYVQKGGE